MLDFRSGVLEEPRTYHTQVEQEIKVGEISTERVCFNHSTSH